MSNQPSNIPPVEIHVTEAWIRFIRYCQTELPHGEVKVKIVNGDPTQLLGFSRSVRFDKPETIPTKMTDFGVS